MAEAAGSMRICPAHSENHERLVQLWERSVRATHDFLKDSDIVALRPLVAAELATSAIQWWVLWSTNDEPIGFLGYSPNTIAALFIEPEYRRLGGGRTLVAFAQVLANGSELAVEVNEQNDQAVRFYRALGFCTIERSDTDAAGRPFPILRMARVTRTTRVHGAHASAG